MTEAEIKAILGWIFDRTSIEATTEELTEEFIRLLKEDGRLALVPVKPPE